MADLDAEHALLRTAVGAVRLERDVVRIHGPEAEAYLQGQLSQDLATIPEGGSAWTFALQPQGKVAAWFRLCRQGDDAFVADVDAGWGPELTARLERFKLRTKAEVEPVEWSMVAVRGVAAPTVEVPAGVLVVEAAWPGVHGIDLLGPGVEVPEGVPECSPAAYEVLRIEAGVPAMGAELTEATIPAEAGVVERSVSFTKGCFTGQELVARIDSRGGNVPRHLRGLVLPADSEVTPGADIEVEGSSAGTVTSVAPAAVEGRRVALGYVRRSVEPPADATAAGVAAQIRALPLA